jgi:hypothetical protein
MPEAKRAQPKPLGSHPAVQSAAIGAAAALAIALVGAIQGSISAYYQSRADNDRLREDILRTIIFEPDAVRADAAKRFIQAGLIEDKDGAICMAFVGSGCPIAVITKPK